MPPRPAPLLVLLAAWLVPGAGHFLVGKRTRGAVFFVTITATFLAGMALCDFGNVSPARHGYYFLAHILNGGQAILASVLTAGVVEDHVPRHFGMNTGEIGTLYSAVAGLLNAVVAMDAFGIAAGVLPRPGRKDRAEESGVEATPAPETAG